MSRTQVTGFTLDSKTTRDIDDAIHVERTESGWRVLVSISDVARAVTIGTPEDEQAKNLVATRYYGAGSSPMLPRPLSEQTLSLWSDRPRKTVSVDIRLSPSLEATDVSIFKSCFVPEFPRLVYDEIPAILGNKEHPCHDAVETAVLLGLDLLERRRAAGALALYDLNHGWVTTEEGYLKRIDRDESTVGYILVQEMMILANAEIAKFCVQKDIPILFRNHTARSAAPAREELLRRIEEAPHIPDAQIGMMRQQTHLLLDRAAYASTLRGHYGLNLPAYTHWTSPIRRYPDLVNHRQLNAFLKGEALPYTLDQLQELAEHLNEVLEVQRVARETHLKGKADSLARKRADDPRRLDSLDAKGIERVVKVEARSGEDVGDVLRDAVVRRLHEGRLPGICAAALFVEAPRTDGWMALREEIAKWVVDRPENAVTLLHLASQAGWPAPTYHVDQVGGPDHAPVFSGSAVLAAVPSATTPVTWSTQAVLASSRKEARQRAAAALVCALADVDPPVYGDKTPVPAPKPKAPSKQDRDPISLLQEKSQAERLPAPQYAFEMSGPSHAPVVTCVVEFNGRTAMGRASSKQDAKRAAARTLVGQFESV